MEKYKAGYFGGCPASGLSTWGLKLLNIFYTPKIHLFHWFVVLGYIPSKDDYAIIESVESGVRLGRLSKYSNYEIYKVSNPEAEARGQEASLEYSRYGKAWYDWGLIIKIFIGTFAAMFKVLITEHKFRKLSVKELRYGQNDLPICTEVVWKVSYFMDAPVCAEDIACIPTTLQQAIDEGKLVRV